MSEREAGLQTQVIFCADPLAPRDPDAAFAGEGEAARAAGLAVALLDFEALLNMGDAARAVRRVPAADPPTKGVYRGWMLSPDRYALLHAALSVRGIGLVNDPDAYRTCHWLPGWYPLLEDATPHSTWLPGGPDDFPRGRVEEALALFGDRPLVVKDYVKSRKHEWGEACFIPSAADRVGALAVIGRFLERQGEDLAGGLVLREYVPLVQVGSHPASGAPLSREYRLFVLDGEVVLLAPSWPEVPDAGDGPPLGQMSALARRIPSRFFALDAAERADGAGWIVIELGDGQVSGLPEAADPNALYRALAARLASDDGQHARR